MFLKYLSISILFALSLQAFSFGDAANALSALNATKTTKEIKSTPTVSKNTNSDLIGMLTSQLGISNEQASGGIGSILNYAKEKLPETDYSKLAEAVPNSSSLVSMAPKANTGLSALSALGGSSTSSGMATLASQFSSLGLDSSMVSQFIPIILDYFKQSNATGAMSTFSNLF